MSLSASLSNALSGLNAASRGAQVVSSNISNALTEGYGRRALETSAVAVGGNSGGVRVDGVRRDTNLALISDRRLSQADTGDAGTRADALSRIEAALGTPDDADSIAARIAALEGTFVSAASRPDSNTRLAEVLSTAQSVAGSIRAAAKDIQSVRMDAETAIASEVGTLNDSLARIADLNYEIRSHAGSHADTSALVDQRQVLVDRIAEIVPLRQIPREHGMIALYTQSGAALVDGPPAEFGFDKVGLIVADMTLASGALSGLTMNGEPVATTGRYAPMGGGRLGALFEQRDVLATEAQGNLDALARDLVERFQDPALDPSLAAGSAGLFTDLAGAFDPLDELGLSERIAVNTAVDPDAGGALWRLRDGLGAASPGAVGDSTLLTAFTDALALGRTVGSGPFAGQFFSAANLAAETVSLVSVKAQVAIESEGFASARTNALKEAELQAGVDTDAELQDLMLYEQAYAANAKVIQAVDQMMQLLMEI
ncbi:flagellar hook-associated protein FlgK [Rhodovulum euryhalinum]|uniref:Flagellar hook-associated protein 1 n=1 Tax=Rhodovulum euryhalinum TaxID=35805 RepID=A0A4R2KIC4_9RHOB|nr:flagellar hook-associated protein FlgK [Rhodovulum euryhalinum]TCO73383.1 flagellar hook-associated protein 1 FlgK [Rhodovulum euryhalinum]